MRFDLRFMARPPDCVMMLLEIPRRIRILCLIPCLARCELQPRFLLAADRPNAQCSSSVDNAFDFCCQAAVIGNFPTTLGAQRGDLYVCHVVCPPDYVISPDNRRMIVCG